MVLALNESSSQKDEVVALARGILRGRRLTVASNRGPVEYRLTQDGCLRAERGTGGVVTALAALSRYVRLSWVASAMTDGDREVASSGEECPPSLAADQDIRVRFVVTPPEEYDLYYNTFSNPILWFVQHQLHELLPEGNLDRVALRAWRGGYVPVNRAFAHSIARELQAGGASPVVMLHDYHLYLVARHLRELVPQALLQQFIHIPWPDPEAWMVLPSSIVAGMCRGLLANNIVGFQTNLSADNFLATCERYLPEARIDPLRGTVLLGGQRTQVRSYPISIDVDALLTLSRSPGVAFYQRRLRPLCSEQTIVRVDRLDPSKNVLTGFKAFARVLARRPDLHGRVKFLSFLVPTRTGIPQYRRYAQRVFAEIEAINTTYGSEGWQPIELFYENNYEQAVAAMGMFDVLMVNSSLDGMNLVSKEAAILNPGTGVLVLSRGAGSHEELGDGALSIEPHDVEGTARALEVALAMPEAERRRRAAIMRRTVERNDITNWLLMQLEDIGMFSGRLVATGRRVGA